ncbi:InlB B-repeat-containing protein [Candidatus Electronema sp. JM]|uniref:InlB B-repeat-containing protein n=1 Tax=Candidatus Electronema sp. JM TaxID=3401571 RepID=UPI003AA8A9A9
MNKNFVYTVIAAFLIVLTGIKVNANELRKSVVVNSGQHDFNKAARKLSKGERLDIEGIAIENQNSNVLELERIQVFTDDAKIIIDGKREISPPKHAYYRGTVQGEAQNIAVLIVPESGEPEGLIMGPDGMWKIEKEMKANPALTARKIKKDELAQLKEFRCGADDIELDAEKLLKGAAAELSQADIPSSQASSTVSYTARVAVETDYEFYALFNDEAAAQAYVGTLFAYISSIYSKEVATSLQVSYLKLWTTGASNDPWNATSGTSAALDELKAYWNNSANGLVSVNRTLVHMLSGKSLGGGVAYRGVLCDKSWAYGVSGSMAMTSVDISKTVWDASVVAHEIGHNFSSRHTHAYCNIGGSAEPIDLCAAGTDGCSGRAALGLPGTGSLTGGTSGAGNGTIMSYCHLLNGGTANIAMTFGVGHPYGVLPGRVNQVMADHVQSRAQMYPGCLDKTDTPLLLSVVTSGIGNGTVTSSPTGISCGSTCSTTFASGQNVTLTASPAVGSTFTGWSGACSGSASTCTVSMTEARSVTATFSPVVQVLSNGIAVTGLAGSQDSMRYFSVTVPSGASNLNVVLSGGSGDIDMHLRFGQFPTESEWDCRPYQTGNNETCSIASPAAGTYYVMLYGYAQYSGASLTASFIAPAGTSFLSASKSGTGSGTVTSSPAGISCGSTCNAYFASGQTVMLTASPAADSTFTGWGGACSGSASTCIVSMTQERSVTAAFALQSYTVNPFAGSGGTISPATAQTVNHGATASFTITPNSGYSISSVTGCGGTFNSTAKIYTTGAITANCTVTATFTQISSSTLFVSKTGSGTVTSSPAGISCGNTCSTAFTAGQSVTLTASPAVSYTFSGWSGACSGTSSTCTVSMTQDRSVTATFVSNSTTTDGASFLPAIKLLLKH